MEPKQARFVIEYCVDQNGTQAALRAGYAENSAQEQASRLLSKDMIKAAIAERMEEISVAASITPQKVLKLWWQIASADPNDIMQVRRVNCRHCYGNDHKYQWTRGEYETAVNTAINLGKEAPDGMGGFGFDINAEANPDCPECGGRGDELIHVNDTRRLKGPARRLYGGVQKTKDGIKVITRDQDKALENIAKYIGMMVERKEISGPGGGPVNLRHAKAEDLTDDELAALIVTDATGE